MPDCTQAGAGGAGAAYPIISDAEYADEFRMRVVGEVSFEGETYSVVNAMPFDYLVSHVQRDRAFPTTETDDYYAVESDFELPYIPCVMDEVAWTPGPKNKGWASDLNTDPADAIADLGSGRPFLYHV